MQTQHGRGPAPPVHILVKEQLGGNRVRDQGEGSGGWSDQAKVEMIQREEKREEGEGEKNRLRRRRAGR